MSNSAYTLGLGRIRATPSEPGDGCDLWFQDNPETGVCLFESGTFTGCSLADGANSCQSSCQTVATNRAEAVAREMHRVEVVAASCIQCNAGYCLGVLQVGSQCFLGLQFSLGYGYHPRPIACDASAEEQLLQSGYFRGCAIQTDAGAAPLPAPAGGRDDAGLPDDAGPTRM